jgi:glycosyltransferase involved in cell wall biosynthesis
MKVAVICLAYGREELTAKTLTANLPTAGMDFGLFVINKQGIAKAMNEGLHAAKDNYEAFCFLANDILEPNWWLFDRVSSLDVIKNHFSFLPGMVSIPVDTSYTGHEFTDVIGNVLITKEVFEKVGYFNEGLGLYGPVDCDYNHRVRLAGFHNYYLPNCQAKEIQPHQSADSDKVYGYSKKEAIQNVWGKHSKEVSEYISNQRSIYLPFDQVENYNINMKEWS